MLASFSLNRYPEMGLLDHMIVLFFSVWRDLKTVLHHGVLICVPIINEGEIFFLPILMPAFIILLFCFHGGHYLSKARFHSYC